MMTPAGTVDLVLLREAAADFRYLLAREYPRAAALSELANETTWLLVTAAWLVR